MKNKKTFIFIILLFAIVLVGTTIAYLQSTDIFENIFQAGIYKTVTTEVFESPTNWKPGDVVSKTITTKNEGTIPIRVRIKLDERWISDNNEELSNDSPIYGKIAWYDLNLDNWTFNVDPDTNEVYYYYNDVLQPGEITDSIISEVIFNENYDGDIICVRNNEGLGNTCEGGEDSYMGATFYLSITTETVQADKYIEVWGDHVPKYSYVGAHPCTYDGELISGAAYVNGQYTYIFDNYLNGWSVILTDKSLTDPVDSILCSSVNNMPIISMNDMFHGSKAISIDVSSFDTSNVIDMANMFANLSTEHINLDLSNFDTRNVILFTDMFSYSSFNDLNISGFDFSTHNLYNKTFDYEDTLTMFNYSYANNLNISNINTDLDFISSSDSYLFNNVIARNSTFPISDLHQMGNFDVQGSNLVNVTNLDNAYRNVTADKIDLSHVNLPNLTSMISAFENSVIDELDLSGIDFSEIVADGVYRINTLFMFDDATINKLYLKDIDDYEVVVCNFHSNSVPEVYVNNELVNFEIVCYD